MCRNIEQDKKVIFDIYSQLPKVWNGRSAILDMKENADPNWRQMEWIGFYAEFLFNKQIKKNIDIQKGGIYGNTKFDYSRSINWDLKAHPNSTAGAILNDCEAIHDSINQFGYHGLIILCMNCIYDEDGSFRNWHNELKGPTSKYEKERIQRGASSRRRKKEAMVTGINLIIINKDNVRKLTEKQKGWRNSNGTSRKSKYYISNEQIHNWDNL